MAGDITKSDSKKANDVAGTEPTLDSEKAKKNRAEHIESFIEGMKEVKAPAYTPSKSDISADGNREAQSVDSEYPITEARKQMGKKAGTPASTPIIDEEPKDE
jgi:hypothetical protein